MNLFWRYCHHLYKEQNHDGMTLIELMVGIVVSAIVITGVMGYYTTYTRSLKITQQITTMMQNLRGAVTMMELDARMTGYDPQESGLFGVTDIRRYTTPIGTVAATLDGSGSPVLSIAQDRNEDGNVTATGAVDTTDSVTYLLYDDDGDGILDFGVEETGNAATRLLIAEGIQAIGFAYAYDLDGDNELDLSANFHTIWAVDIDQDGLLDTALDSDDDGDIDEDDTGAALASNVPLNNILMVRIWLLAQTTHQAEKCGAWPVPPVYVVAEQRITDPNDCFRRRLLVRAIECKNLP